MSDNKSFKCGICLCDYDKGSNDTQATPCMHVFHNECLTASLKHSKQCPMCKTDISELDNNTLTEIKIDVYELAIKYIELYKQIQTLPNDNLITYSIRLCSMIKYFINTVDSNILNDIRQITHDIDGFIYYANYLKPHEMNRIYACSKNDDHISHLVSKYCDIYTLCTSLQNIIKKNNKYLSEYIQLYLTILNNEIKNCFNNNDDSDNDSNDDDSDNDSNDDDSGNDDSNDDDLPPLEEC